MTTTFDWSEVAPAWEAHREHTSGSTTAVSAAVLQHLAPQQGEQVLELGCGTGDLSLVLCDAVGPSGKVVATDVASGMADIARRTLGGLPQAEVRTLDAAATGLPAASFDAVAFVMGLMFLAEPEKAVAEVRRVLRPGGRAAFAVWAGPQHNPWLSSLGMAAMAAGVVAGGPPTGPGGLFSLADPERFRSCLAGAFDAPVVDEVPIVMAWPDAETWFDQVSTVAGPLAAALAAVPESLPAVRETATTLIAAHAAEGGLSVPGLALVGHVTA